jgi:hypothetical protein
MYDLKNTVHFWEWPTIDTCRTEVKRTSNEGRTKVGRKLNRRRMEVKQTLDEKVGQQNSRTSRCRTAGRRTKVGWKSNENRTDVEWKFDESLTNVGRTKVGRHCCDSDVAVHITTTLRTTLQRCGCNTTIHDVVNYAIMMQLQCYNDAATAL